MNKNTVKYLLALAVVALAGGGCEVNDFNDKLDGFEGKPQPGNTQTIPLTLSAANYSAISSNKANAAIAEGLGADAVAALKAIGTNKFIDGTDAQLYMPAFLSETYSYLDNGSAVDVSYVNKNSGSETLEKALQNQYTLESEDYDAAWGADNSTPFFTNKKPADEFMPAVLKAKVADAAAGDYAIATYAFSNEEPVVAAKKTANTPATRAAVTVKKISEIDFTNKEEATAEGIVIGLHTQGVLFQDETGIALWFKGTETFYALGDKIQVSGKTELRNGVKQFSKDLATSKYMGHPAGEFAYPTIDATINKDNIATYTGISKHVKMVGELLVDGNYLNVTIDGMDPKLYRGSLSYVFPAMDIKSLGGKQIEVTGYYIGTSGSSTKNFTMMVTGVKEVGSADDITAAGVAAAKAGNYTCKGIVVGLYDKGFLMNDGTGNILVYQNKTPTVELGTLATVKGDTEIRFSMAQFKPTATITAGAKLTATLPAPTVLDAAAVEAYMTAPVYTYAKFEGKLSKSSGGYYEVHNIEGTEKYGSFSYPLTAQVAELDKLLNKSVSVTGYLIGSNTSKGYFSVMFGSIEQIIRFETEVRYGIYSYNGSSWAAIATKDAIAVNESDYKEMGLQNIYFDNTNTAGKYVPAFLSKKFPYAQQDQSVTLFYNYKETTKAYTMGGVYKFDGAIWSQNLKTEQYVKSSGAWKFNPSPTIVVAPDRSAFSAKFYQACADYVIKEKPKYATKYNDEGQPSEALTKNEMYSGCDAIYTNLNWRINTLPWYYWKWAEGAEAVKVYEDWTSTDAAKKKASYQAFYTEIEKRFGEVMSAALSTLYPTAAMMPDMEIIYTVQMMLYTQHIASNTGKVTHAFEFKLVGTGQFKYVRMYALDPQFELMKEDNFK